MHYSIDLNLAHREILRNNEAWIRNFRSVHPKLSASGRAEAGVKLKTASFKVSWSYRMERKASRYSTYRRWGAGWTRRRPWNRRTRCSRRCGSAARGTCRWMWSSGGSRVRRSAPGVGSSRARRRAPPGSRSGNPPTAPRWTRPGNPDAAGVLAELQPRQSILHRIIVSRDITHP